MKTKGAAVQGDAKKAGDVLIALKDEERTPCEIWTRVMGYHRPLSSFNKGKKGEFYERKYFRECKANLA